METQAYEKMIDAVLNWVGDGWDIFDPFKRRDVLTNNWTQY